MIFLQDEFEEIMRKKLNHSSDDLIKNTFGEYANSYTQTMFNYFQMGYNTGIKSKTNIEYDFYDTNTFRRNDEY